MKAGDIVAAIESMNNGERIRTLKLLHETYFYNRDFPSDLEEEEELMVEERAKLPESEWVDHDPNRYSTVEEVKERFYPNNYKPIKLTGKDAQDVIDELNGKVVPEEEKKRIKFLDDCKKLYENHERKRLLGQIVPEDYLDTDEEISKMAEEAADEEDFILPQAREKYIEHFIRGYKDSQEKTFKRLKELENSNE
ncbi:hypothetical protein [Bacillus sp. ISL-7]|uniref:hypothetical protein n=1 Tax=Bacillus sp. ISL-7 TaxID=2819136 RepID=UPI001BEA71D5|nr:hypothetical protein [Bacillus sp. ISL-7]MBT2734747.1 hypothetical protein [Bacillus sp. ISL-7]